MNQVTGTELGGDIKMKEQILWPLSLRVLEPN